MGFLQDFNTDTLEAWRVGDAIVVKDAYEAMFRKLIEFGSGKPSVDDATLIYVGVGDGLLDNLDLPIDGPTETWSVVATSPTNFTVTGTVTGALAAATVDVAYSNGGLSFTIVDGATPFVAADRWDWDVTLGALSATADQWIIDRWNPNNDPVGSLDDYLHWHGEGDGTEAIYCGIALVETPASQIWNWKMRVFTGYDAGQNFDNQPGTSDEFFTALHNDDFRIWLDVNARRYAMAWEVNGTTYHSLYQGFFIPYGSPNEYPYPICVLGEKGDEEAWNSSSGSFAGISNSVGATGELRTVSGVYLTSAVNPLSTVFMRWPAAAFQSQPQNIWPNHEDFDNGDQQLFPIVLVTGTNVPITDTTTLGELDGVRVVTGFTATPEDVITIAGDDHVVFQDIFRSQRENFWTLELRS